MKTVLLRLEAAKYAYELRLYLNRGAWDWEHEGREDGAVGENAEISSGRKKEWSRKRRKRMTAKRQRRLFEQRTSPDQTNRAQPNS